MRPGWYNGKGGGNFHVTVAKPAQESKRSEFFLGRVGRLARYRRTEFLWVLGRRTEEAHEREFAEGPWSVVEKSECGERERELLGV